MTTTVDQQLHVGRSWAGTQLEDACACEKGPCGLAVFGSDPDCPQHSLAACKTMRQGHVSTSCPGTSS